MTVMAKLCKHLL